GHSVSDLTMEFLHDGRPPVVREATFAPLPSVPFAFPETESADATPTLLAILGSLNVCSKEWIIRQYDHEVQGGSVIKPLCGPTHDGPSDAAVVRPRLGSRRGVVFGCGMNPHFGDFDPYDMAASAIDEAVRNCIAVGADPARVAILDNFCWGNTDNPTTLGTLVRAALACHDMAVALQTPFISGKDSLNNEFRWFDSNGKKQSIAVPSSLLISAMGQVEDVAQCVTMDLKAAGNLIYQVGVTRNELGGSHYALVTGASGGQPPTVDPLLAKSLFTALHKAIKAGLVKSCHDLSEGGLAVAIAEMAFAGGLGATIHLAPVPHDVELSDDEAAYEEELAETLLRADVEDFAAHPEDAPTDLQLHPLAALPEAATILLFSESNTRFLVEVAREDAQAFEEAMQGEPIARIGEVVAEEWLTILGLPTPVPALGDASELELATPVVVEAKLASLKEAWQAPLRW
ncbi:MAG TPA: AIR synthase-related protein, partial [Pirellulales bacterium]